MKRTAFIAFAAAALAASHASAQTALDSLQTRLTELAAPLLPYWSDLLAWLEEVGTDELSPVGMFMAADWVVKAVMLSLAFASVLTWLIFAGKLMILAWERHKLRRNFRRLDRLGSLRSAEMLFSRRKGVIGQMVRTALREQQRSGSGDGMKPGIKERSGSEIARIEAGAARRMSLGTGVLANIGSTAPFVGLFGTVWGIMNSFISISESNTTNLAVVAPGIAEALLATAIGLVAAIPAVIFYNLLARGIGGYKGMLADAGALVERTLSRDLDKAWPGPVGDAHTHHAAAVPKPAETPVPNLAAAE